MKELNNSIYHEPGVGLLIQIRSAGAPRFYTQQGLEALIRSEKRQRRACAVLETAHAELVKANQDYQRALWERLQIFARRAGVGLDPSWGMQPWSHVGPGG